MRFLRVGSGDTGAVLSSGLRPASAACTQARADGGKGITLPCANFKTVNEARILRLAKNSPAHASKPLVQHVVQIHVT
jgi:hypothetical protein